MQSEGVNVDETEQAWRGQALQRQTLLIEFVKKETATKGHLVAVAAEIHGSQK